MALVKIYENIFENIKKETEVPCGKTVEQLVRELGDGNSYNESFAECYDCETGETFFAPIDDDTENNTVMIRVNGNDKALDYCVKKDDLVEIFFLPADGNVSWSWEGAWITGGSFALGGAGFGAEIGGGWGALIGGIGGFIIGFIAGGLVVGKLVQQDVKKYNKGETGEALPDVRGASNQSAIGSPIPSVLGKCLATPKIVGSPYNDIYGMYGDSNYINALYLVGYGPLKITDIKLGDQFLAHNQSWAGNRGLTNVFCGKLKGTLSDSNGDYGEIVNTWSDNDVTLEIIQQKRGNTSIDWGSVYPYAKLQEKVDANCLFIVDGNEPTVSYKGLSLKQGLRNNPVRLTQEYPLSARIELDFPQGLYKTWTEDGDVKYSKIPLWLALQWRVYSDCNDEPNGETSGIIEGEFDSTSEKYWRNSRKRGWNTFEFNTSAMGLLHSLEWTDIDFSAGLIADQSGKVEPFVEFDPFTISGGFLETIQESFPRNVEISFELEIYVDCFMAKWHVEPFYEGEKETITERTCEISKTVNITCFGNIGDSQVNYERYCAEDLLVGNSKYREEATVNRPAGHAGFYGDKYRVSVKPYFKLKNVYVDGQKVQESVTFRKLTEQRTEWVQVEPEQKLSMLSFGLRNDWKMYEYEVGELNGLSEIYTSSDRTRDFNKHTGNSISNRDEINKDWLGARLFNLERLGASKAKDKGLNEIRVTQEMNFVEWARNNLEWSTEKEFVQVFKDYFYPVENTTKSIEVRVVRISPNYIDETSGDEETSAAAYSDVFKWTTLTSSMLDEKKLFPSEPNVNPSIATKRPISEELMRKCCLIALRAKTDNTDQLSSTIKKLSCVAQSFAPYFDSDTKTWVPENVNLVTKYYKPNVVDQQTGAITKGQEITREQFIQDRQNGIKSVMVKAGNDFVTNLVNNEIMVNANVDSSGRYILPVGSSINKYIENNVASGILWAGLGAHTGINALSYDDYDLISLGKVFEFCKDVRDGSIYKTDGYHYNHDGERVHHTAREEVSVYFTANGYIYDNKKLEDLITALCTAGRCVWTRTKGNKLTFIIDKPEKYYTALVNEANLLSFNCQLSYAEPPAGLQMTFKDENDGFTDNVVYAMADGEREDDYRGNIEPYSLQYVTNAYQVWSLGRYYLANRIFNKETPNIKMGMEGYSIGLGNLIKLQYNVMETETDLGGRITELIEDDDYIYGFVTNTMYEFTGEVDGYSRVTKGVSIMQPSGFGEERIVTLRMAGLGATATLKNGKTFTVKRGSTNTVILEKKIIKDSSNFNSDPDSMVLKCLPQIDNIVGFGIVGEENSIYRVIGIKSDSRHNFDFNLIKYDERLYNYGRELPEFNNGMVSRDYNNENYALSSSATKDDLVNYVQQIVTEVQNDIETQISEKVNNKTITLYKRSITAPSGPTSDATYDFTTNVITWDDSSLVGGWTDVIPDGTNPLYAIATNVITETSEAEIPYTQWTTPRLVSGSGGSGTSAGAVYLFKRSSLSPAVPSGDVTFNFSTKEVSGDLDGWSTDMGGGDESLNLWVITAAVVGVGTGTIDTDDWSTPLKYANGIVRTYKIESDVETVTKVLEPSRVEVYLKPNGSYFYIDTHGSIIESQGTTISLSFYQHFDDLLATASGWYKIYKRNSIGSWDLDLFGEYGGLGNVSYEMPNTDIKIQFFKEADCNECLDTQIISVSKYRYAYGLSNNYVQIPTNNDLETIHSGSFDIDTKVMYNYEDVPCEDFSQMTGTTAYKIMSVTGPKDSNGDDIFTIDYTTTPGTISFSYALGAEIPEVFYGSILLATKVGSSVDAKYMDFTIKAVKQGDLTPADEDTVKVLQSAKYKPNVQSLTFNFYSSSDSESYEEYEGYSKLFKCKNGEWIEAGQGVGTSVTYELEDDIVEEQIDTVTGSTENTSPVLGYSIVLYKDETFEEVLDSETIPVLFEDGEVRINLSNDNVTLIADSSGAVQSLAPTATGITVYKGTKKLFWTNTALDSLEETESLGYFNISYQDAQGCSGTTLDTTDPQNIKANAITSLTVPDSNPTTSRQFTISYYDVTSTNEIIGYLTLRSLGGRIRQTRIPIYKKEYKVVSVAVVQMISKAKNGEKQRLEFALARFGLDPSNPADLATLESLTWSSTMPQRTEDQCLYMRHYE